MNIRTRLAIAIALVLMITISLLGTALVRSTRETLVDQVDEQVVANAVRIQDDPPPVRDGDYGGWTAG